MSTYTSSQLKEIFYALGSTLYKESTLSKEKLSAAFEKYKETKYKPREDNEYFNIMVSVVFYSGFKAKTVEDKMPEIKKVFNDYKVVAKFSEEQILNILKNDKIIRNEDKIRGIVNNAKQIVSIVKDFGSFNEYLESFGSIDEETVVYSIIKDLEKRFKYLGEITAYHFIMDLGFNVLKPDRVLCRIFYRLGFVSTEKDKVGVVNIGREIAKHTGFPIRHIDIAFVLYGQVGEKVDFGLKEGICINANPKCKVCEMIKYCRYNK